MMVLMVLAPLGQPFLTSITLQHRQFCSLVQICQLSLSSRPSWAFLTLPGHLQLASVTLQHRRFCPIYRLSLPSRPSWVFLTLPARDRCQKPVSIFSWFSFLWIAEARISDIKPRSFWGSIAYRLGVREAAYSSIY